MDLLYVAHVVPDADAYKFLLDNPRSCFTHLFPRRQTLLLLSVSLGTALVQWFFMVLIDWSTPALSGLEPRYRVLNCAFQSIRCVPLRDSG